jgi:hypothetical protein
VVQGDLKLGRGPLDPDTANEAYGAVNRFNPFQRARTGRHFGQPSRNRRQPGTNPDLTDRDRGGCQNWRARSERRQSRGR